MKERERKLSKSIQDNQLLHSACENADLVLLKRALSQKEIDVNQPDKDGRCPLHLAVQSGNKKVIDALLASGADINIEEPTTNWNVLHFAASTGDSSLFYRLVSDDNIKVVSNSNRDRNTPLHYFCRFFEENYLSTIELMLKKGAKVNCQNYNGETPLHNAAWKGHSDIVQTLLENNANPNLQSDHGETPLHWAARVGYEKVVRVLLKGGADPKIQGSKGTPLAIATSEKIKEILKEAETPQNKESPLIGDKKKIAPFQWEIQYSELKSMKEIGRGGFGVVYKGEWRGIEVAIKQIIKEKMSPELFETFIQEISIMSKLHHPNVLLLYGACLQPKICYVTEFMTQGSLRDVLLKNKKLEWKTKLNIAVETARAMKYLHGLNPPVLHQDLKSLNILIDENYHVKVADFGLSRLKEPSDGGSGLLHGATLNWAAPEIVNGDGEGTEKSDVYSFGMVCWELTTHKIPYEGKNSIQIINAIVEGIIPKFPKNIDQDYQNIVAKCWKMDAKERPDFNNIYSSLKKLKSKKEDTQNEETNTNITDKEK